jgi:hypothetical protein
MKPPIKTGLRKPLCVEEVVEMEFFPTVVVY